MRSYHSHLESLLSDSKPTIPRKPTHRTSAIFPVFQTEGVHSRVSFLGYWKLKRHLGPLNCVVTLRSDKGMLVTRHQFAVADSKAYRVELADLLESVALPRDLEFWGSLEIELFSSQNLVFPFPAVVVNYYGPSFSTVVHTAQRVYNDFDDLRENSVAQVPESGFNLYADENTEPFFTMINGPEEVPTARLEMTFFNHKNEKLEASLDLGRLAPYQTTFIYPSHHVPLQTFLDGRVGCAKVRFEVHWIFPRLIIGNFVKNPPSFSVTHSYYDCTEAAKSSDYWHKAVDGWYPAILMVPVQAEGDHFTNAYFYPILSPCDLAIDVEFYNSQGLLMGKMENVLSIHSPSESYQRIPFKELLRQLDLPANIPLTARIIARALKGSRLPTRIKLGLDTGTESQGLPCNICTNLQPFNPSLDRKPHCFRWAPILADTPRSSVWLLNGSPKVDYDREAVVRVLIHREQDEATLTREVEIPANGSVRISPDQDPELEAFLNHTIGWLTAESDNPYLSTYYYTENPSGTVGGDHGF